MKLFHSVTEFVSPELVETISRNLREDKAKILSTIQTTIASIFEIMVDKKESKRLHVLLKHAGSSSILLNYSSLFREEMSFRNKRTASKFSEHLFQEQEEEFFYIINSISGLSEQNAKKIISRVMLLLAAYLGEFLVSGISLSTLKDYLEDEQYDFQQYIPLEMSTIVERSKFTSMHKLWATLF